MILIKNIFFKRRFTILGLISDSFFNKNKSQNSLYISFASDWCCYRNESEVNPRLKNRAEVYQQLIENTKFVSFD